MTEMTSSDNQVVSTNELRRGHSVCILQVHPPTSSYPTLSADAEPTPKGHWWKWHHEAGSHMTYICAMGPKELSCQLWGTWLSMLCTLHDLITHHCWKPPQLVKFPHQLWVLFGCTQFLCLPIECYFMGSEWVAYTLQSHKELIWLLACKNRGRRPGESYHMIRSMTVICHHTSFQQPSDVWDRSYILC